MFFYAELNDEIMAMFGEAHVNDGVLPVFHTPDGDVPLDAVLEEAHTTEGFAHQNFNDLSHTLMLPTATLVGTGIASKQKVTVRGVEYDLIRTVEDSDGMTTFGMRRYS